MRWLLLSLCVAACGRTNLVTGAAPSQGDAGNAGTPSTVGGQPAIGGATTAGKGGAAATAGRGGAGGQAGSIADGGEPTETCDPPSVRCGDACVALASDPHHCGWCTNDCGDHASCNNAECVCTADSLVLQSRQPENGFVGGVAGAEVTATFNCAFEPRGVRQASARLSGGFSGAIAVTYPEGASSRELRLQPQPAYLPGERVTVWLGEALGSKKTPFQPFQWQFVAGVNSMSPGQFRATADTFPTLTQARNIALGDVDRDGDLDAVVSGDTSLILLRNQGNATFGALEPLVGGGVPLLGDVDGDGDLDLANGQQLLLNDGLGNFSAGPVAEGCVTFGDFDGDGDLDCLANVGYQSPDVLLGRVLLNAGDGTMQRGDEAPFGFECETWDLDGDGDLDAACVSPVVTGASILLNGGNAHFETAQTFSEAGARALALGDIDGDHDIDIVVSKWHGAGKAAPNLIYINDGKAHFDEGEAVGSDGGDIALGDIDGNGTLDIIYSHLTPYGPIQPPFNSSVIAYNDGSGHFTSRGPTLGDPAFQWFELGDLDGDRDLDALVFHQLGTSGNYTSVWLNQL